MKKQTPQVLIREYNDARQMNREVQKMVKQGWLIADTQTITTRTDNAGCLFGLFGSMRSKHKNKYLVRYEKRAA